jgi:hypothetical protein
MLMAEEFFDNVDIFESTNVMGMSDRYVQQLELGIIGFGDIFTLRTRQVVEKASNCREPEWWHL